MIKKKKTEDKEENEIGWRAAEYDHIEKGGGWYATVGAAVLILPIFKMRFMGNQLHWCKAGNEAD